MGQDQASALRVSELQPPSGNSRVPLQLLPLLDTSHLSSGQAPCLESTAGDPVPGSFCLWTGRTHSPGWAGGRASLPVLWVSPDLCTFPAVTGGYAVPGWSWQGQLDQGRVNLIPSSRACFLSSGFQSPVRITWVFVKSDFQPSPAPQPN